MKSIKSIKWSMLLMGIITILVGAAILFNPRTSAETVIRICGFILIAAGAVALIAYLIDRSRGYHYIVDLLVSIVVLALGIVLAVSPGTFVDFIGYIFAIILAVHGINDILTGAGCRKYDDARWTRSLLVGILCIALAAIIFFVPFSTMSALMLVIGIALLIDGLTTMFIALRVGFVVGKFEKAQELAAEAAAAQEAEYTEVKEEA